MLGGSNNPKPLAMSGGFLPQDYVEKKAEVRASLLGGIMFLLVMGGVAGAYLVTTGRWSEIRSQQSVIDEAYEAEAKKIDQLKALEAQRTTMLEKAEIVTSLIEPVPRSVLLAELMLRMPSGVSLLDFELKGKRVDPPAPPPPTTGTKSLSGSQPRGAVTPTSGGKDGKAEPPKPKVQAPRFDVKVKITGVAKAQGEIADYLAALNSCDLLEKVELLYIQDTIIKDVDLRKFEIEAMIRPGADGRAPRPEPLTPAEGAPATQMTSVSTDTPAAAGRGE
ncbi:MAG: PilN domain-containing protein [Planctomycetota bacterium]|nr:PilN domain-containing protein [Planctomycetota bacterium]